MKDKKITFRTSEVLDSELKNYSDKLGISKSQLIELAVYNFLEVKKVAKIAPVNKTKNHLKIIHFRASYFLINNLEKVANEKNSTVSQEIRYRLNSSLTGELFDIGELTGLIQARKNISKLGNLFKLAINQNCISENDISDLSDSVSNLKLEINKIIRNALDRRI